MEWPVLYILIFSVGFVITIWTAGAIYYDAGGATWWGAILAITWSAIALLALWYWQPAWKPLLVLVIATAFFLWWWFSQQPSGDRNWDPNYAQLPRVELAADTITIHNVRNTEYRSLDDNDPGYESRSYRLSQLRGVDALLLYWGSPWMSHPMVVFDFGPDGRVCISIEVRYRVGQKYDFFRSLYRQQELIYVVCDERDAILRRTKHMAGQDLYLYRLFQNGLIMRQFFFEYANTVNRLAETPRWYNGVTSNCTTGIYAQGRGRMQWDWRMLFNGKLDQMMYERGLLDRTLPFAELRRQSWINDVANRAPEQDFGDFLRRELPGYRSGPDPAA